MANPTLRSPYHTLLPNHIRLLRRHGSILTGFTYDLIDTPLGTAPSYEALSYVWGDQERSLALQLGDANVLITPSLGETLHYLSEHCTSGYLWVDQICINQTDWDERSQQVKIMGQIFSTAKRVLIWLGKEESNAVELATDGLTMDRQCIAVRNILELPWFRRGWVVQEAVLPPKVTFFMGTWPFDIDDLWVIVKKARGYDDKHGSRTPDTLSIRQMPGCFVLFEIDRLRYERKGGRRGCFYYTLSVFAPRCHTTRPEDSIFGFLGLVDDPRIQMTVDYNMDVDTIPILATREIIKGTESLDVLGSLHRAPSSQVLWPDLPSWVPHWTRPLGLEALVHYNNTNYFNASGGRPYREFSPISSNKSHLIVSGAKIDEVQHTFQLNDVREPNSDRCGWDVYKLLDLDRLETEIRAVWLAQETPITTARLLVTLLADGSFAFTRSERRRCRDGLSETHIEEMLETYNNLQNPIPTEFSSKKKKKTSALRDTFRDHARVAWGRSVIVGDRWRLGLTDRNVEKGDMICAISGSKVPLVLRPVGDGQCRLVGQCYFEGAMRGEEIQDGHLDQFVLV